MANRQLENFNARRETEKKRTFFSESLQFSKFNEKEYSFFKKINDWPFFEKGNPI